MIHWEDETSAWAESLLTGQTGSIVHELCQVIPENSHPFTGYVWFNDTLSKQEIVQRLCKEGTKSGSFIIRPSESESGCYTLLVRGNSQVEKLKIKDQNGKLVLGNRDFFSMKELISRYQMADIRPGASLKFILQITPPSPALPPPKIKIRPPSTSGPKVQKMGWIMVYSSKSIFEQIPHGTWKKYWTRLEVDFANESFSLIFFDSEKKTRPRNIATFNQSDAGLK